MPIVNAYGKRINFPDDMSHEEIANVISANEKDLNPDYTSPNPEALDYAKGFAAGANKLVSGVGYLAEAAGAKETGKAIREFGDRGATYWNSKLSPGGKKAAESQVFVDDPESITGLRLGDDAGKALLMGASQSLPSMFATALPGVAITKGIQALASLGLAGGSGATIPLLAGTAANVIARVPSAIGFGAAEGIVSGAMNAADFKSSIEGMSDKELSKSPVYLALKAEHGEEKAKQLIADQAASDIFGRTALSTGAIGAVTGGGALGQAYQKATTGAADGIVGSFFKGGGQEFIQEYPQSGGEKYIENLATKKYLNPDLDTMSGVSASAASGGATGAFTGGIFGAGSAVNITTSAQQKADRINAERAKLGLDKIVKSTTVDEAINAANESVSQRPVDKDDVLRVADPTLADIERLTGLKPSESLETAQQELDKQSQAHQENNATQSDIEGQNNRKPKTPRDTEIVLPDNKTLNAQWDIVDADNVKASLKNGESQPRDRIRAASDLQVQSIAKNPDYRRLSDSPVMDIGAPVLSNDGKIVGGNGRFEAISRAYDQGSYQEYLDNLKEDAIRKGIDPAVIDQMKKPVLVRRITQPFDTRQLAIKSNSGLGLPYSDLELSMLDAERMNGIENLDILDNGNIALTNKNFIQLKDSLGDYNKDELAAIQQKDGTLSQQGISRIRNAILAKAYGDNPILGKIIESTDSDIKTILGSLTRIAGDVIKAKASAPKESDITPSILEAVNIYNQLRQKNQPVSNYLKQQDAFSENVSPAVENILMFLDKNARSQPKLTEFFREAYTKLGSIDTKTADIFGEEVKPKPEDLFAKPTIESQLEKHLKKNGYEFDVKPVTEREFNSLDESKKAQKELAEKQAKIFGKKVVFVKTKGKFGINGVMVPAIKDTIFIDLNTPKPFHAVMAHELSHWMEQENPKAYKDMLGALKNIIINEEGYRRKYNIDDQTEGLIPREIAGDLMGDNFTKTEFWQKVAEYNPSKFKEIAHNIIKWLKNIILKAKARGMGSEEWVTDAKKAQDIIAKAVSQYTESGTNVNVNNNINFSGKIKSGEDARNLAEKIILSAKKSGIEYDYTDSKSFGSQYITLYSDGGLEKNIRISDHASNKFRGSDKNVDIDISPGGFSPTEGIYEIRKFFPEINIRSEKVNSKKFLELKKLERNNLEKLIIRSSIDNKNILPGDFFELLDNITESKDIKSVNKYKGEILEKLNKQESKGGDVKFHRAFHGSPHDHNKFDSANIGTGEGAQAYGYGHYFTDNKEIAEYYKNLLSKTYYKINGHELKKNDIRNGIAEDILTNGLLKAGIHAKHNGIEFVNVFNEIKDSKIEAYKDGKLYEVELAPKQDEYLLWDKPLSEQSEKVKPLIEKALDDSGLPNMASNNPDGQSIYKSLSLAKGGFGTQDSEQQKAASEYLHSLGIRGIKYLDGTSRAKGEGAYNYVIFDDKDIEIKAKFSKQEETNNKEELPKTINIDGTERPTTNSEGKPIYPTEEGIRNFWKWFGDSKVVDDQGRPLVVYHGTDSDITEFNPKLSGSKSKTGAPEGSFFFADDNRNAASYTVKYQGEWTKEYHEGGNVIPVYLSLNDPLKVDANNENWNDILYKKEYRTINEIAEIAKLKGKDSVIVSNVRDKGIGDAPGIGDTYVAFSPDQIKSAIGNNGEFSEGNNDIRFSKIELDEFGEFKTGVPVTFNYLHNKESATELLGIPKNREERFGRFYEPSGKYIIATDDDYLAKSNPRQYEFGQITFNNPLVIKNNDLGWKKELSDKYNGLIGKNLSKALIADGYDGVVTVDKYGTSEILDLTSFDESKAKFSFAGENSETANKYQLSTAQQMLNAGIGSEAVRQETGWFKGSDGRWRYEINDRDAKLGDWFAKDLDNGKTELRNKLLPGVLWHDKLYAAYPSLREIRVDWDKSNRIYGKFDVNENKITVRAATAREIKSVLLHEIQHGIQKIEGFATGGSPDKTGMIGPENSIQALETKRKIDIAHAINREKAESYLLSKSKEIKDFVDFAYEKWTKRLGEKTEKNPYGVDKLKAVEFEIAERDEALESLLKLYNKQVYLSSLSPLEIYRRLYGEIESRNVQARINMDDEERRLMPPYTTQDVPDRDAIVMFNGNIMENAPTPKNAKPFNPNEDIPETKAQKAQRIGQDKFNRFRVIKEWLAKEKGINLSEAADVYGAEERYYGKVANQQEDFREKVRNPLIEKISKAGYKLDDVEQYLLNRHAQEANAQNRKLTGKEDSTAYGISDADAKEYLAKAPKELAKLADEVQALTDKAQQLRLDNGIETDERVNAMKSAYQYYVPVRGDAESQQKQNQYKGTGKGFSMKYKPKRRLGHELRNESVIENIFQDYERAIIQVEKNRIGKSLALMAAEIQMPELISIDQPVKRKVLQNQKAYGVLVKGELQDVFQTEEAAKQNRQLLVATDKKLTLSDITIAPITDQRLIYSASPMLADNEVLVYMNGHEIRLQINDELLARAYKNMGTEALGNILSTGRAINGWMSKAYTGYNPEFILTNLIRDFTSGIINLTGNEGILIAAKAVANYPKSFSSLLKYAFTGKSDKWIDAYRDNGGNTGAAYLPDLERLGEEVRKEYASYQGVIANLKEGDSANALRAAGRKAFNATLKYINHLNSAGENAFRLATFKAMVESGKSVNEAASMAKNVTVNFNRKGEMGAELNALYLFFNASLQGTAATSHALFKGRHKFQAWGLSGAMMAVGYMMASMLGGFDDEDKYDEIGDATKSRNLIMAYGDGHIKIPVPYGYGFFYNAGRMYAEAQRKGEVGKMPYQLMALATEEFSPFNVATTEDSEFSSKKVFYEFLPTMLKIPAEITNNYSSFANRELYPEKTWYKSEPDNEKMWRGTKGTVYDISAQYLASIGVEISPETLKYMTRTATGGSGAFVDSAVSGAMIKSQGAELEAREIPFARKFYGENTIQDARARYGKAKEEARIAFEKFNALRKKNDIESVRNFVNDKKELLALNSYANKLSDVIKNIRDQQDLIKLSDKYTTAEKRLKIKELENQEKKYYDMFMKQYKTVKH